MTYYIGTIPCTPYMEHFGIKGQKWGERRYQNEDGSLTEAGKARYSLATKGERRTLENLKKIKQDKNRMSSMSDRQKKRLDDDIEFYTKRLTGEVKKKNILTRRTDAFRSQSFEQRSKQRFIQNLIANATHTAVRKIMENEDFSLAGDGSTVAINSVIGATYDLTLSELYNRAVGRY